MHNILTKDKDKEASIDIGVGDGAYAKIIQHDTTHNFKVYVVRHQQLCDEDVYHKSQNYLINTREREETLDGEKYVYYHTES